MKQTSSSILDDAREKIFKILFPYATFKRQTDYEMIDQILALSGTTDIECSECKGRGGFRVRRCGKLMKAGDCLKCQGSGKFKHKWKIEVRQVVE